MNRYIMLLGLISLFFCCSAPKQEIELLEANKFESSINGKKAKLFTLRNSKNTTAQITNLGGRLVSFWAVDRDGNFADICFGFRTAQAYLDAKVAYCGATVGRFANRIAGGSFVIESDTFQLQKNSAANTLHGGHPGFHEVIWDAEQLTPYKLELSRVSPDGEAGFPGNLKLKVSFELTEDNELKVEYRAKTDKITHINLTNHAFFNLSGEGSGQVVDHIVQINADHYTIVGADMIPTGEIIKVDGTPFDFRKPTAMGKHVDDSFEQLSFSKGYDHNFVLNSQNGQIALAAKIKDPKSGRTLEVSTNEPGLLFNSGNHLKGDDMGKYGVPLKYREAFCVETQHYPNSPNIKSFPSTLLKPEEEFYSVCVYKVGVE